jgi:hypothetical protein
MRPTTGIKFDRDVRIGETIARAEYGWKMGRGDWQVSLERAYNGWSQVGRLFVLGADGEFDEHDFPEETESSMNVAMKVLITFSPPADEQARPPTCRRRRAVAA